MQYLEDSSSRAKSAARRTIRVYGLVTCAVALLAVPVACSDSVPTGAPATTPDAAATRAAVTGAAAAAVDRDGRIQLFAPADEGERILTAAEAVAFASVWVRDYAPMTKAWLEKSHGAPINLKALTPCGRPLYARSAFSAPPKNVPAPFRRARGAWWLLTYCDAGGAPSVSVAMSAWAELSIENGKLHFPRLSGTEIVAVGVPAGHVGEYPSAPEFAIQLAAKQTGRRVSQVPDLITPLPSDGPPQLARWRLALDEPATVQTASGQREIKEVFVSPTQVGGNGDIVASAAVPMQPAAVDLSWTQLPVGMAQKSASSTLSSRQITRLTRRADAPIRVEPISAPENH